MSQTAHETTVIQFGPRTVDEQTALKLRREAVRESSGNAQLDAITSFAAQLCGAPIALVTLVEEQRQRFIARTGLEATESPRSTSFCAFAMIGDDVMIVPDATRDLRFVDNPLVTAEPHIRFYAGAPLIDADGEPLGALCVIDRVPRAGLTPLQAQGLKVLAAAVTMHLGIAQAAKVKAVADSAQAAALNESEGRFRLLADTMPQMVWSTRPDGYHDYYNARWYEFTGMPAGSTDGEEWNGMFHPEDQERAWSVWRESLATGEPYQIEYRLRHHSGEYRWTLGRALPMRSDDGTIVRWFGTCTDIHTQKLAAEEREVISQELSHRIKNIFSVVAGLISFAAKANPQFADLARDLRERILALGRAHDFVRPHSDRSRPMRGTNSLQGLLEELFAPYRGAKHPRVAVTGEDFGVDDRSATPFALLFHELATNAAKYGALSTEEGQVTLDVRPVGDILRLTWSEAGGPPVTAEPDQSGFGSRLLEMAAVRQLGGSVDRRWLPGGLEVEVAVPRAALNRQPKAG